MPKTTKSSFVKLKSYIKEFGEPLIVQRDVSQNEFLYCKACQVRVVCDQRSQVRQHINTQMHIKSMKSFDPKQQSVAEVFVKNQDQFNKD